MTKAEIEDYNFIVNCLNNNIDISDATNLTRSCRRSLIKILEKWYQDGHVNWYTVLKGELDTMPKYMVKDTPTFPAYGKHWYICVDFFTRWDRPPVYVETWQSEYSPAYKRQFWLNRVSYHNTGEFIPDPISHYQDKLMTLVKADGSGELNRKQGMVYGDIVKELLLRKSEVQYDSIRKQEEKERNYE